MRIEAEFVGEAAGLHPATPRSPSSPLCTATQTRSVTHNLLFITVKTTQTHAVTSLCNVTLSTATFIDVSPASLSTDAHGGEEVTRTDCHSSTVFLCKYLMLQHENLQLIFKCGLYMYFLLKCSWCGLYRCVYSPEST